MFLIGIDDVDVVVDDENDVVGLADKIDLLSRIMIDGGAATAVVVKTMR